MELKLRISPALITAFVGLITLGAVAGWAEAQMPAEEQQRLVQRKEQEKQRPEEVLPLSRVVPDQYATVQAAIDAAKTGDTILVKAGVYHEALKFKEGIDLRGESRENTVVRFSTPPTGVLGQDHYDIPLEVRNCKGGSVQNITFQQDADDGRTDANAWKGDAIDLFNSSIHLKNCGAISAAANGILVAGVESEPDLTDNKCSSSKNAGIVFEAGAKGKATGNFCERNGQCGILVNDPETAPELDKNQCRQNQQHGIGFADGAQGQATGNTCENNLWNGIAVWAGSDPQLVRNQCRANKYSGINFWSSAGKATGNICDQNEQCGIFVHEPDTAPELDKNQCRDNQQLGIGFGDSAQGEATENICENNSWSGIGVWGSGTGPQLIRNQCRANKYSGISFWNSANGKATGNVCEKNDQHGILVSDVGTAPVLVNNHCQANRVTRH